MERGCFCRLRELLSSIFGLRGSGSLFARLELMPSWLAGVAMSTTSVAVVYAVLIEFGSIRRSTARPYWQACFVTDLWNCRALGLIFAPFTMKTLICLGVGAIVFCVLPWLTPRFFRLYGGRPSELETKFCFSVCWNGRVSNMGDSEPCSRLSHRDGACKEPSARITRSCGDWRTLNVRVIDTVLFYSRWLVVSIPALVAALRLHLFFYGQDAAKWSASIL